MRASRICYVDIGRWRGGAVFTLSFAYRAYQPASYICTCGSSAKPPTDKKRLVLSYVVV